MAGGGECLQRNELAKFSEDIRELPNRLFHIMHAHRTRLRVLLLHVLHRCPKFNHNIPSRTGHVRCSEAPNPSPAAKEGRLVGEGKRLVRGVLAATRLLLL